MRMYPIGIGLAVLAPAWKLVLNLESPGEWLLPAPELYRVDVDPGETRTSRLPPPGGPRRPG